MRPVALFPYCPDPVSMFLECLKLVFAKVQLTRAKSSVASKVLVQCPNQLVSKMLSDLDFKIKVIINYYY